MVSEMDARMMATAWRSSEETRSSSARHRRSDRAVAYAERCKECLDAEETSYQRASLVLKGLVFKGLPDGHASSRAKSSGE